MMKKNMEKPSFLSIAVDSPEPVGYRVWFEQLQGEQPSDGYDKMVAGSKLKWIIIGVVVAACCVICMIVKCVNSNSDTIKYQQIDKNSVQMQTFNNLQAEDDEIFAGDDDEFDEVEIHAFEDKDTTEAISEDAGMIEDPTEPISDEEHTEQI